MIQTFLFGAIWIVCWAIAYFFFRFARQRSDSLFSYFSMCFVLLGLERVILLLTDSASEFQPYIYVIRLIAFSLIIVAIVQKNRSA